MKVWILSRTDRDDRYGEKETSILHVYDDKAFDVAVYDFTRECERAYDEGDDCDYGFKDGKWYHFECSCFKGGEFVETYILLEAKDIIYRSTKTVSDNWNMDEWFKEEFEDCDEDDEDEDY